MHLYTPCMAYKSVWTLYVHVVSARGELLPSLLNQSPRALVGIAAEEDLSGRAEVRGDDSVTLISNLL